MIRTTTLLLPLAAASFAHAAPTALIYNADFETDEGYTVAGTSSWERGAPTSGPGFAYSGTQVWCTNLAGNYNSDEDGYLLSPLIDLSATPSDGYVLRWRQALKTEANLDFASVEVTKDGGATWTRIYGKAFGEPAVGWTTISVLLDTSYAASSFQMRWHFTSDPSQTESGWYLDDVEISRLDLSPACYMEDFESETNGYTATAGSSWERGIPVDGPGTAFSGTMAWATNLSGNYNTNENSTLTSPTIDLSGQSGRPLVLAWQQFVLTEERFDTLSVETSKDDGATWVPVYGPVSGSVHDTWVRQLVQIDSSHAVATFRVRFKLQADVFFEREGIYIDDIDVCAVASDDYSHWLYDTFTQSVIDNPSLEPTIWGVCADFDGDGIHTAREYFHGTAPSVNECEPVHLDTISNSIEFQRAKSIGGIIHAIEWSTDMVIWSSSGLAEKILSTTPATEWVRATATPVGGPFQRLFFRINVLR